MDRVSEAERRRGFFIGWAGRLPEGAVGLIVTVAVCFVAGFAGAAFLVGATVDDPGAGGVRFDWGRQTVTGVVEARPYPILHVTAAPADGRIAPGRSLMLTGLGKRGAQARAAALDGQVAVASGVVLARGDLLMLQVRGGTAGLAAAATPEAVATGAPPTPTPLGRWRVTGEICDGKCLAGAMRPGRGLAHRACANLCLIGGVPPVLVATDRIAGHRMILLAGPDGGPVTKAVLDSVGMLIEFEGALEQRGDLPVLRIDPASVRRL